MSSRKRKRIIRGGIIAVLLLAYLFIEQKPSFNLSNGNIPNITTDVEAEPIHVTEQQEPAAGLDFVRPEYSGDAYTYVNNNVPYLLSEDITDPQTTYQVDALGRPIGTTVIVSKDDVTASDRGDISHIYPPGWNQAEYEESVVDGGYIYNRCHLIAHSLGGPDIVENLITGTRFLNIDGMWQLEETVLYYVRDTGESVMYRVTPVYESDELIPRGVLMEAYSINDNGSGLSFCVYCHNVQPYINIDYHTGETSLQMN